MVFYDIKQHQQCGIKTIQFIQNFDDSNIFNYNLLILNIYKCFYICLLNDDNSIFHIYMTNNLQIQKEQIKNIIYTNHKDLFDLYDISNQYKIFNNFKQYADWLSDNANNLKIIYIPYFNQFHYPFQFSKSQLLNINLINQWWNGVCNIDNLQDIKYCNFFNYVYYLVSKNELYVSKANRDKFKNSSIRQELYIDVNDVRCKNTSDGFNYFVNLQSLDYISAKGKNLLLQIDYEASVIQLLGYLLGHEFNDDPYMELAKQLNLEGLDRKEIKKTVLSILYSLKIKDYKHIVFFKKASIFIEYLIQQYGLHNGYINSLITERKLYVDNNQQNLGGKLLSIYLLSLELELYTGLMYDTMCYDYENLKPAIFIYDSIVYQIYNVDKVSKEFNDIYNILTINNILRVNCFLGYTLNKLKKIQQ